MKEMIKEDKHELLQLISNVHTVIVPQRSSKDERRN